MRRLFYFVEISPVDAEDIHQIHIQLSSLNSSMMFKTKGGHFTSFYYPASFIMNLHVDHLMCVHCLSCGFRFHVPQ